MLRARLKDHGSLTPEAQRQVNCFEVLIIDGRRWVILSSGYLSQIRLDGRSAQAAPGFDRYYLTFASADAPGRPEGEYHLGGAVGEVITKSDGTSVRYFVAEGPDPEGVTRLMEAMLGIKPDMALVQTSGA